MKRLLAVIISALLLLSLAGCGSNLPETKIYPKGFEKYYELLGQKWDVVMEELGLTEADMDEDGYRVTIDNPDAEFMGLEGIVIYLHKGRTDDRMYEFDFGFQLEEQTREAQAAKLNEVVRGVYKAFTDAGIKAVHGAGSRDESKRIYNWTQEQYLEVFEKIDKRGERKHGGQYWILGELDEEFEKTLAEEAKAYALEKNRDMIPNGEVDPICVLQVNFNPKDEPVTILLRCYLQYYADGVTYWLEQEYPDDK